MNIKEMHTAFRTVGQQMGLQQVRAILPESIDIYLNTAIIEIVRNKMLSNTQTVYQDKVTLQHNPVSPINAFRNLYVSKEYTVSKDSDDIYKTTELEDIMFILNVIVKYDKKQVQCRLIEPDKVPLINNDYCNKATKEYPIATCKGVIELFTGSGVPTNCIVEGIKYPAKVKYDNTGYVNCDLLEYLHNDVVELAVQKFLQSIKLTTNKV